VRAADRLPPQFGAPLRAAARAAFTQGLHVAAIVSAALAIMLAAAAGKLGLGPSEERPGGLLYRCGHGEFALFQADASPSGSHTQMAWQVSDIDAAVAQLKARGVVFEEYDLPGLTTAGGIAQVAGNYPSKGSAGERAA
jgi:hypothetical protein